MPSPSNHSTTCEKATVINVAVAVIHYKEQYLLGFRNAAQHQGNRYEFVGGKIEASEDAKQAVIREVAEETGFAIHENTIVKLGRLHHDYGDKQVSLQVYKIELTALQYEQHKHCQYGLEKQALTWVSKADLLAEKYDLPAANKTMLEWLKLPANITITYPLSHFDDHTDPAVAWLQYHEEKLTVAAWVYVRTKEAGTEKLIAQLTRARPDIHVIVPHHADSQLLGTDTHVVAHHLTHTALMQWFNDAQEAAMPDQGISSSHPLIVSCHDADSITAANKLARARLQQQLPPVVGAFLSPVLATQTHPDAVSLGWETWSALAQLSDIPIIGLGGLSPTLIDQAISYGGVSVAGIRQFLSSQKTEA